MQLFRHTLAINFTKLFKISLSASLIIFLLSIAMIFVKGLGESIDFKGGTTFNITFSQSIDIAKFRVGLRDELKQNVDVVHLKNGEETSEKMTILLKMKFGEYEEQLKTFFKNNYPYFIINQETSIGPKIGDELKTSARNAIIISLLLIGFYIAIRFDRYYAIGSLVALLHDIMITIGIFSLLNIEISITIIAALLTIVGYSLNDTIVIYDRIRENMIKLYDKNKEEIINTSLNETLNRTFITSFTTLIVIIILYFFGGDVLQPFALALIIGVLIGTYSSIFIASPVMLYLEIKYPILEITDLEE